jgi:hypothetical protein
MSSTREEPRSSAKSSVALAALLLVAPALMFAGYFVLREPTPEPTDARSEPDEATPAPARSAAEPNAPERAPASLLRADEAAPSNDDASAFAEIEPWVSSDPARALALVQAQNERFPDSSLRDDRDWAKVRALVHQQNISKARGAAKEFYRTHPTSPFVPEVHALTGMHLPPKMGPAAP